MTVKVYSVRSNGTKMLQMVIKGSLDYVWNRVERFSKDNPTLTIVTRVVS